LQGESLTVAARKSEQLALVASVTQDVASQVKDQRLVNTIEQKQIVLGLKQRVLSRVAGQESLKSSGFSDLMLALASTHEHGIWLTQINLNGQEISIEGAALESSSVPKWLNNLGTSEYFIGREFATTRLYRDPQQQLFFVLDSQYSELNTEMSADER
ncbi:MAG: Tfp pilus assembly protein PilN, partial [Paraglaciecola sp.]